MMNRVAMFERASPSSDRGLTPSPEQGARQTPKYGKQSPVSDPPKWQKSIIERNNHSPHVKGKGTDPSSESKGANGVGWPSPDANKGTPDSLRPSQFKKQIGGSPSLSQNGVLGARNPKSSFDKPSPSYLNRKSPQPESPYSEEVKKLSPGVGWPSPGNGKSVNEKLSVASSKPQDAPKKESNPAVSHSQDENEAPEVTAVPVSEKLKAFGERAAQNRDSATYSDVISAADTFSSVGSLSRNLKDASVVMKDERDSIASGSTAARSSLSVDELSSIAMRALRASRSEDKKQPPVAITTTAKSLRSPRRRQRFSHPRKGRNEQSSTTNKPEQSAVGSEVSSTTESAKTNASARISVVSSAPDSTKEKTVVSTGQRALTDKKSRNQLFETARQRNRSPSPSILSATSDDKDKPAKASRPNPESSSANRVAMLSKGRRRLAAGALPGLSRSFSEHSLKSSVNPSSSEDASISTQDTNSSSKDKRTTRMAVLAAAQRHSQVPSANHKQSISSKAPTKSMTSEKDGAGAVSRSSLTKSRSARRMVALSSSNRSASPLPTATESKKAASSNNTNVRDKSNSNVTPSSKTSLVKPKVMNKSKDIASKFNGRASQIGTANSNPQASPGASSVIERKSASPGASSSIERNSASPGASSAIERKSAGSVAKSKGLRSPDRASSRVSDHPAMRAKRGGAHSSSPYRVQRKNHTKIHSEHPIKDTGRLNSSNPEPKSVQNDDKREPEKASSDISSSGGVKAAIGAWTSKSKEIQSSNPAQASPTTRESPQENRSEANQSDGSLNTQGISSEVSVGGSLTSFFSSPSASSHASSRMSVGAPGSFFRPMDTDNDFEDTRNDNMLGQLSGTSSDEDSSTLPSHLFQTSSKENNKRNEDTELSFLLEQMKSESDSEDSVTKLLATKERSRQTTKEQKINAHGSRLSFGDNSNSTANKTASITLNEPSTLLGQSLVESDEGSAKPRSEAAPPPLTEHEASPNSSDSRFIKWWQKTDPAKRRQTFEPYTAPALQPFSTSFNQQGTEFQLAEDDDLFSGLSYDEVSKKSIASPEIQQTESSGGEDVFSGVAPSVDSQASQSTHQSAFPPPPPPPPLQEDSSDQFGTILLHGSHAADSVGSDITSSVLDNDMPKDWARREATAVIQEEMTADIEDEESDKEAQSDRRQKEGSVRSGHSRGAKDPLSNTNVDSHYGGVPLDMEDVPEPETPKGGSIFMSLGCSVMEPFARFCAAPSGKFLNETRTIPERLFVLSCTQH